MGEAAKALKRAHADMDVDKVHDMMDDIAEQQDVAKEISEAISNPVAFGQEFDDDELEAELDELEVITFLCFLAFTFVFSSKFSYFAKSQNKSHTILNFSRENETGQFVVFSTGKISCKHMVKIMK